MIQDVERWVLGRKVGEEDPDCDLNVMRIGHDVMWTD